MKERKYTAIKNPLGSFRFSFGSCHATEFGFYAAGVIIGALMSLFIVRTADEGRGWSDLREALIVPISFALPFLICGLIMTLRIRKVRKIMTEGETAAGRVVSYRRIRVSNGRKNRLITSPNFTLLDISFDHHGEQHCTIGVGNKLPQDVLASDRCTVYISGDRVFVTGFEFRKRSDPKTEFTQTEHYY